MITLPNQVKLTEGQEAVLETHSRWARSEGPSRMVVRVGKVWKNGILTVKGMNTTFNIDGWERGKGYNSHLRLRAFNPGETPETIKADTEAAQAKCRAEKEAKDQAHQQAVEEYWKAEGESIWNNAITLPDFLGKSVRVLKYKDPNSPMEEYMPFVIIEPYTAGWLDDSRDSGLLQITMGGLHGSSYERGEKGQIHTSISTFSRSSFTAKDIKEAVYLIVH